MTERGEGRLYQLLPAVYRVRDAEQGEPLRRLLKVIEAELQGVEDDVAGLFENWFIETCEEWVVPYIGDLLGVQGLHPGTPESFSLRGHVANTLAYRRRKGTAAVLEQVAVDTTGWRARVVEAFQRLAVSASVNHPRTAHPALLSVRGIDTLQYVDGPFDQSHRSVDVRHVASGRGRFNLPHVALWLWRLTVLETSGAQARALGSGRFTLDPWSWRRVDGVQLFNRPRTELGITQLARPEHVPDPLRRLPLYREVEAVAAGTPIERAWFPEGEQEPVVAVRYLPTGADRYDPAAWQEATVERLPPPDASGVIFGEGLAICHLGDRTEEFAPSLSSLRRWLFEQGRSVGLDPESGRLLFREGLDPDEVLVDLATGTPGRVGGGAYRAEDGLDLGEEPPSFLVFVTGERAPSAFTDVSHNWVYARLQNALDAWEAHLELWHGTVGTEWRDRHGFDGARGVIVLADSRTYDEAAGGPLVLTVPSTCRLSIVSARFSRLTEELTEELDHGVVRELVAGHVRPHLRGNVVARAQRPGWDPPTADAVERGRLTLHGLHLEGSVDCPADALGSLTVLHATIAHDRALVGGAAVSVAGGLESMDVKLFRCVVLGLAARGIVNVTVDGCVLDAEADGALALDAPEATVSLCASTLRGATLARTLSATDTLFTGVVEAIRRQEGCVRFSFVPAGSRTPRRFRCQPDLALGSDAHADSARERLTARLFPGFVGTAVGDAAYFQLAAGTASEILSGAEDGAEMGVWHHLRQPQRAANLRASFTTYLRFGLEAGGFHAT
jgi:hypothetical protein